MAEENATGDPRETQASPTAADDPDSAQSSSPRHAAASSWGLVAAAVAVLGAVVATIAIIVSSSSGGSAHHPVAGPARTAQPSVSASAPRVSARASHASPAQRSHTIRPLASHGIAKSALRFPRRLKWQISRWEAGPGGKALAAVTAQMGYAMQDAGTKLYLPMKVACISLASDIRTAQAGPPIPDAAMQRLYGTVLAGLSRTASNCQRAISSRPDGDETVRIHLNNALLTRTRLEFAAESARLYTATARIRMP
jgi:hypothetical protein